jgi:long-chain acyl-CoA synthetase
LLVDVELYRRDLQVGGAHPVRLSAIDIGPSVPRRTFLFLHGFGGSAAQWEHQLRAFSQHDRAVALDLRGHGQSEAPPGPYDMPALVADAAAAVRALKIRPPIVLVGHSFGAALAVEAAVTRSVPAERLVLIAAAGEYPLAAFYRAALALPTWLLDAIHPFVRRALSARPEVLQRIYRQALRPWVGWDRLRKLPVPTLVVRGHRDRVFGRQYMEEVARVIPRAQDVHVGASGHMVMLERREAVNRAIERFVGPSAAPRSRPSAPWVARYDRGVPEAVHVPDIPLPQLLESSARRFPYRPAMWFAGQGTSYHQLEQAANRFAQALLSLGVLPGDRVMILLPNLPQSVVTFYGALKAGAVAVFATPLSEPEELLRQIRDSHSEVLITLTRYHAVAARALQETELRHALITGVWEAMPPAASVWFRWTSARASGDLPPAALPPGMHHLPAVVRRHRAERPRVEMNPQDLAVLQYTGGTTDVPRGVMLTHRNLVANTLQVRHWIPDVREGREVVLSVLPFSHIYGLTTAMSVPIALGGAMIILPTFRTSSVLEAIRRYRPTLFPGVPAMYTAINDFPGARRFGLQSIRACISGAAPLPVEVQEAFERLTRGKLVEGYGLTEASPVTHANPLHGARRPGSIGLPIPGTEAKIVDLSNGRDLPPGKVGELAVRGPQVMRGYWKRPAETREALRPGGWLLTGDLARMDLEGYFTIVARKKEMILAGAYQVYPRDVEEVLHEHPKVREAAVVGIRRRRWPSQKVKAYVVLRQGESLTSQELIELCRTRLKSYAVPWEVEFVPELPKSFVGKVLRRVLIEREESSSVGDNASRRRRAAAGR